MENQGVRLKKIIKSLGYSNKEFAEKVSVSSNYISILIKNPSKISTKFIYNITKVFPEINTEWILTGKGSPLIVNSTEEPRDILNENNIYYSKIEYAPKKHKIAVSKRFNEMLTIVSNKIKDLENQPKTMDNLIELKKAHLFKLELLESLEKLNK